MGLMSSFHCIGMCGPIALALPIQKGNRWQQLAGLLLYNSGRALTYAFLGLLIGSVSSSLAWIGYLRYLSVFAGIIMLSYVFWPAFLDKYFHVPMFWQKTIQSVRTKMGAMLRSRTIHGWLFLGILNGLLPCGMVYLALISSVATGSMAGSGIYMLLFGIGTLPMMMMVGFFKQWLTPALRSRMRKITPIVLTAAGIWLVARGVLIEYPTNQPSGQITICHGK
ncbi:sulfite exporter TauE/SafE family protein [Dyadobacter psychrotolerans]|uniref:Sulfite exporter TauE/SafE family protein n=2 Tax=Dyadobacter psychrotolerans TaxID=2541721 RepID=A0A4R5DVX4_9BACT|nr:sulfite exporter TauE/SafE family protein [Dyadobacter psychrotolerans]